MRQSAISDRNLPTRCVCIRTTFMLGIPLKTMNEISVRMWRTASTVICCLLLVAMFSGCEKRIKRLPVYQVAGKILVNGQPAEHAQISLQPVKTAAKGERVIIPNAIALADGTFNVGTYTGTDGAPAGEYAITVIWPTVTMEGGEETFGPDRLKGRYRIPGNTIPNFTVQERDNEIPTIDIH